MMNSRERKLQERRYKQSYLYDNILNTEFWPDQNVWLIGGWEEGKGYVGNLGLEELNLMFCFKEP